MSKELVKAIADMREEEALTLASKMMEDGRDPTEILDAAREAMARKFWMPPGRPWASSANATRRACISFPN